MELKNIKSVYFVGAGGIGMSAIARYFIHRGLVVAGYDKTPSALTAQLEKEGMLIHYEENSNTRFRRHHSRYTPRNTQHIPPYSRRHAPAPAHR